MDYGTFISNLPNLKKFSWGTLPSLFLFRNISIVLGASDTGKTTLIERIIDLLAKKTKLGIVDLDVGQSHIGPPTTLAWGLCEGPFAGWEEIEPLDIYFTGSTSSLGNLLSCLTGAKIITDRAVNETHKVIIDTTGLIEEGGGSSLKEHKLEMIRPDLILGLQKNDELEHILSSFKGIKSLKVMRLPVSKEAQTKSPSRRGDYRQERFKKYFANGRTIEVSWKEVGLRNTFNRDVEFFTDRLVGLVDDAGRHRALGIVENADWSIRADSLIYANSPNPLDYGDSRISIFSPIDSQVTIGCIIFGKHKIDRNGYQIE